MTTRTAVVVLWVAFVLLATTTAVSIWSTERAVDRIEANMVALDHTYLAPPSPVIERTHDDEHHGDHTHDDAPTAPVAHGHTHTHTVIHAHPSDEPDHGDPVPVSVSEATTTTAPPDETTIATTDTTTTTTVPVLPDLHSHTIDHEHDHVHVIVVAPDPQTIIGGVREITPETLPPTTFVGSTPP